MAGGLYWPGGETGLPYWTATQIYSLSVAVDDLNGAPFHTPGRVDLVAGAPVITYSSRFGINAAGVPYYDPNGAVPGEDAILTIDDGVLSLTKLEASP